VTPIEPTLGGAAALTDREVEDYLRQHTDFFSRHPSLLSVLKIPHPQAGGAVSLVERQAAVLRERIRSMEMKLAELIRHGQENDAISGLMQRWVRGLFLHSDVETLPGFAADSLAQVFSVPMSGISIWHSAPQFSGRYWAGSAQASYVEQVHALTLPLCGPPSASGATALLPEAGRDAQSIAVLPLRIGAAPEAYGVLVLGSPDAGRFSPDLGVSFLERIAEIASAALARTLSHSSANP
jgi:uncharacterized protein